MARYQIPQRTETHAQVAAPAGRTERRLDHLVVIRESSASDQILMEGMIHQTLARVPDLPDCAALRDAGMRVFTEPEAFGSRLIRLGDSRMVIVARENVAYLYSMGTAAKNDLADSNAFIEQLVKLITDHKPRSLTVASFTRLMRSTDYLGDLLKALRHVDMLYCEADIAPQTEIGMLLIQCLAMFASTERDMIVRRHTAGRVSQYRRGDWIVQGYPPGYKLVDSKLRIEPRQVDAVRKMLVVLGDERATASELAQRVGALGVSTPKLVKLYGESATVGDAADPSSVIDTLLSWIEVYEHGRYEVLWRNPFRDLDSIAGVEIDRTVDTAEFPYGALRLPCEVPTPPGGWGVDATFAAIRRRLAAAPRTGINTHTTRPPLAGIFRFTEGDNEFHLSPMGDFYDLLRRPVDPTRTLTGWWRGDDIECTIRVRRADIHASICTSIADSVEAGLPVTLDTTRNFVFGKQRVIDETQIRLRLLRRQRDEADQQYRNAFRNANRTDDASLSNEFIEAAEQRRADRNRLDAEIAYLEADPQQPELANTFESAAGMVAEAVGALATVGSAGPAELQHALSSIIHDASIRPTGDGKVRWQLSIDLPHEHGVVTLHNISGVVAGHIPRRPRGVKPPLTLTAVRDELVTLGLSAKSASSAVRCPHPQLIQAIRTSLNGDQWHDPSTEAWARHVAQIYRSGSFMWRPGAWSVDDGGRRRILALLDERGGSATVTELAAHGVKLEQLRYLTREFDTPTGQPILRMDGWGPRRTVYLLDCPHCGDGVAKASVSIVTPETKPGVLCPKCRRTLDAQSPVFPVWYVQLDATTDDRAPWRGGDS